MFRAYFKTAVRNLRFNKSFTFINISGLAVGIASCLLIFLVIEFETSFDNYHAKKDRIYRVVSQFNRAGNIDYTSGVSNIVPATLRNDFPQLEAVGAIAGSDGEQITVMDNPFTGKKFKEFNTFYAEPQIFNILDIHFLAGDKNTALSEPNTVVLSRSMADKCFGDWKLAMGKIIKHENRETLKVTGIIEDVPVNSDFPFTVVISYKTSKSSTYVDWGSTSSSFNCLVVLPNGMKPEQLASQLPAFRKKHAKEEQNLTISYLLQPLKEVHYDRRFGNYNQRTFSKQLINSLSLIAAFLLLIACVNFINLSTAQAVNRSKEVGIKKVLGSSRVQLALQFFGETFLITLSAMIIACLMAWVALPYLGALLHIPLTLSAAQVPQIIVFLVIVLVSVSILSGLYPAIILCGFNPANALKNKITSKTIGGISLRRGLVVLQFVIAQVLIIGTLVVLSQMKYFRNADMGFDKNAIINVPLPEDSISHSKMKALKQELLKLPGINTLSYSFAPPTNEGDWTSEFTYDHQPNTTSFEPTLKWADADYFKTYNLQFIAGRPYVQSDTVNEFVVNEALVKALGIKNPQDILGREISFWNRRINARVVGVIKDFHANSLRDPIAPAVMACYQRRYETIGIKLAFGKEKETLAAIEKLWTGAFPDYIYEYKLLDDKIANFYAQENQLSLLYAIFAAIAIFISCLGLYGLVSFMAIRRTKEVGIRKVLGASSGSIVYLFSKEFTLLILGAFVIAAPLSYIFMRNWLNNFTFRIDLGIGFFIVAIAGCLAVAWITVGYKSIKAAVANPVKSLRTE